MSELMEILNQFSKKLAMVQGEYNAGTRLSTVQKNAEDAQYEAEQAIEAHYAKRFEDALGKNALPFDGPVALLHSMEWYKARDDLRDEARKRYYQDNTEQA